MKFSDTNVPAYRHKIAGYLRNQEEGEEARGFAFSINFPVLLGRDEISRDIGFDGELPTSILVTRDAREVKIIRGPLKAKELSSVIRRLL